MINAPFEKADLPNKILYDFVIMSPPNFIGESSVHEDNQAPNVYPTEEDWFQNFLIASIKKCIKYMSNGGHFLITILDRPRSEYFIVEKMLLYIQNNISEIEYEGVIGWQGSNTKIVPFFVFVKK